MYDENGKLTGRADNGLISQKVQRFVKENKTTLLGGAALGLGQGIFLNQPLFSSALGLLPGMGAGTGLLGGLAAYVFGPVTIAMGTALLLRNEKVQKMIFGEIDGTTGEREGGLISKKSQQFMKRAFPNIFAGGALGAGGALMASTVFGSGILGGLLTPYAGAVIGAATGFGLASEKFRTALFGEQNEKGEFISGGMVDRAKNFFQAEVFNPIANFFDIEFMPKIVNEIFNKSVMNHIPLRDIQEALPPPKFIRHMIPSDTQVKCFLRQPEIRQKIISVIFRNRRKDQNK
jgi:hypothetical protein